ncbi:MAG: lactonase family protein [Anaerolineales bacterium]|nr:lactonase family protein [Anaerolineales bacterium]
MSKHSLVFIGTYTEPILFGTGKILQGKGEGIYVYRLDGASGALKPCGLAEGVRNPSYLAFDASLRFLYAVNELKEFENTPTGAVSAFLVDPDSGRLRFLNQQPSHGTDPCHLTVDRTGRYVLVANFMSGSVCVLPIREDGSLGDATDVIQHQGSSADPVRQSGPHAHAVTLDNAGRYVFVPDLGIDKLMVYKFDAERGKLEPNEEPWVEVTRGAGPRQLVAHPGGGYAYLINELNSTLTAFRYEKAKGGMLREIQTLSTLPEDFQGTNTCAEVQISPSGKFLYGSNRGHDSIVIYAIDQENGRLTCMGYRSTQGKTPRHFGIDPAGEFLVVANQDTESVITFRLDPTSGDFSATGHRVDVPTPVCVRIM